MILQILEIINKIASVIPMTPTVTAIVQGFQQSLLFGSVLPGFINESDGETKPCQVFFNVKKYFLHQFIVNECPLTFL